MEVTQAANGSNAVAAPPKEDRSPPLSRTLLVSRSAPPGVSGSAHVLEALLRCDGGMSLVAVGGRRPGKRWRTEFSNLLLLPTELSFFGRGARFLAPIKALLGRYAARRIETIARKNNVDRIIAVFPDAFYCEAALVASRRTDKPIDFWFHNTYADNRSGIAGRHARNLETQMLKSARRIFFISDALRHQFADKHPEYADSFHVLRHPVPGTGQSAMDRRPFGRGVAQATLMGNFNESNIDATRRMIRALGQRDDIRIRLCTPVPRMLLAARGVDLDGVDFLGYLDAADLQKILEETDIFLLPHGLTGGYSAEEYRTIFPTRAAHYLSYGKPILAHSPEGSGLTDFLIAKECAIVVTTPSEEDIAASFEMLKRDPLLQAALAANALEASRQFEPASILEELTQAGARK